MSKMLSSRARFLCGLCLGLIVLHALNMTAALGQDHQGRKFGSLKAERILFLGNSLTFHGPKPEIGWTGSWGMSASAADKDFVHLLTAAIEARTNGKLVLEPRPLTGHAGAENILNIADILERGYATYEASRIQKQLEWKADIVIVQCGENVPAQGFDPPAFRKAFQTLLDDLKTASDPHIFVTGNILSSNPELDAIKREACAEDSAQRTFVDISDYAKGIDVIGQLNHPNDKGMQLIADRLLAAMAKQAEGK